MSVTFSSYSLTVPGKGIPIEGMASGKLGTRTFFNYHSAIAWLKKFVDQVYGCLWSCRLNITLGNGMQKSIKRLELGWPGDFDVFSEYLMNYFDQNPEYG